MDFNDISEKNLQALYGKPPVSLEKRCETLISKEGVPVKHFTRTMAIVLATMVLLLSVAVAAGPSVFSWLYENEPKQERFLALEEMSQPMETTFVVKPAQGFEGADVAVTITNAYYDGTQIYIGYRTQYATHEDYFTPIGRRTGHTYEAEAMDFSYPEVQRTKEQHLKSNESASIAVFDAWILGCNLPDGKELQVAQSHSRAVEDGQSVGYCRISVPKTVAAEYPEEITVSLVAYYRESRYHFENGIYHEGTNGIALSSSQQEIVIPKTESTTQAKGFDVSPNGLEAHVDVMETQVDKRIVITVLKSPTAKELGIRTDAKLDEFVAYDADKDLPYEGYFGDAYYTGKDQDGNKMYEVTIGDRDFKGKVLLKPRYSYKEQGDYGFTQSIAVTECNFVIDLSE